MKKNKKITTEDLARMVQRGFEETAKKADVDKLKSDVGELKSDVGELKLDVGELKSDVGELKGQVNNIENKVNQIDRRLFSIEEDISEIKIKQYGDLLKRVNFIERKLGIASGK